MIHLLDYTKGGPQVAARSFVIRIAQVLASYYLMENRIHISARWVTVSKDAQVTCSSHSSLCCIAQSVQGRTAELLVR